MKYIHYIWVIFQVNMNGMQRQTLEQHAKVELFSSVLVKWPRSDIWFLSSKGKIFSIF